MNVCVILGSPKGESSTTLYSVKFLEKKFPEDSFSILHAGSRIRMLEKDFGPALEEVRKADLLLFAYPVYTFMAPSQLHRFIELLKESGENLTGKPVAQLSTSMHFFDTTAQAYVRENCEDMGMRYLEGLQFSMDGLTVPKGQQELLSFWRLLHFKMGLAPKGSAEKKDVAVVADLEPGDSELAEKIELFRNSCKHPVRLINIRDVRMDGGCLGCLQCVFNGSCCYKDGFDVFLREEIQTADAILYAFRIKDHSMGTRMKMYDDRQFCNGHRTVTEGKPTGYIIAGDIAAEPNLQLMLKGRGEVGGNYVTGLADNLEKIREMAELLSYTLQDGTALTSGFLGVGGMKVFRDMIWKMQGLMKADHKFYKEHNLYDFPQKEKGTILAMKLVGFMLSRPALKKKISGKMNEGMLMPYKKVLEENK